MISKVRYYPNFNLGQLKVYKLMFALELSMNKKIKVAGFSVIPAIISFGFTLLAKVLVKGN